jgi:hypothetical protein
VRREFNTGDKEILTMGISMRDDKQENTISAKGGWTV